MTPDYWPGPADSKIHSTTVTLAGSVKGMAGLSRSTRAQTQMPQPWPATLDPGMEVILRLPTRRTSAAGSFLDPVSLSAWMCPRPWPGQAIIASDELKSGPELWAAPPPPARWFIAFRCVCVDSVAAAAATCQRKFPCPSQSFQIPPDIVYDFRLQFIVPVSYMIS